MRGEAGTMMGHLECMTVDIHNVAFALACVRCFADFLVNVWCPVYVCLCMNMHIIIMIITMTRVILLPVGITKELLLYR